MFIKQHGRNYYWYATRRVRGKVITSYHGKATPQEVKEWKKVKEWKQN